MISQRRNTNNNFFCFCYKTRYEESQLIFFKKKKEREFKNQNSTTLLLQTPIILKTKPWRIQRDTASVTNIFQKKKKKANAFFTSPPKKHIFKNQYPPFEDLDFQQRSPRYKNHLLSCHPSREHSPPPLCNVVKLIEFPNESQLSCKTSRWNSGWSFYKIANDVRRTYSKIGGGLTTSTLTCTAFHRASTRNKRHDAMRRQYTDRSLIYPEQRNV